MKAIKVTQTNKRNFPNNALGSKVAFREVPKTWYYNEQLFSDFNVRESLHESAGFLPLNTNPSHDSATQRINTSNILEVIDNNIVVSYVYEVVNLTETEIKNRITSQAETARQEKLQAETLKQSEKVFQDLTDDAEVIANADAYPLWQNIEDGFEFEANYKVRDFDENNELQTFKIIIPHAKQVDRIPIQTPNLWSIILFGSGGLELWKQPIGGDGKYPYLDPSTGNPYRVEDQGQIWENNHRNENDFNDPNTLNVWVPGVFGWTLIGNV